MKKRAGNSIKELSEEHPIIKKKINKSLDLSIKEGSISAVSTGVGPSYFAPFALAMQATSVQVGILSAISSLFPAISQLWSCKLLENHSRKKIIITSLLFRIFLWIPIILISLFYFNNISYTIWIFIGLVGLFYF